MDAKTNKKWFESEYSLMQRLRHFSSQYFLDPRYFYHIGLLAESLFWFVRKFSDNIQYCSQTIQSAVMQHCRDLLTISARLMLNLRVEIKLRLLLHYDSSKRVEKNCNFYPFL